MWFDVIMSVPLLAIYSVACLSLGAWMLGLIFRGDSVRERCGVVVGMSSAMLLGQGVLAGVWLLIGLTGHFRTWVVAVVLMVCVLVGWRSLRQLVAALGRSSRLQWTAIRSESRPWRLLAYLLIAQVITMGLGALFRPARGDAVAFYMTIAKYMAHYERLVPLPTYHTFTQIGLQGEMHFAALMSLGSESAAKGFVWPTSLAGLGMLLAIGGMVGLRRRGKWIAIAMYFTSTAVTLISIDAKVDLFAAAMGLGAVYWALRTSDSPWQAACLCGLFTSLAVVAKFSYAGALVPGVFILLVWRRIVSDCDGGRRKAMILTGLVVLAIWGGCAFLGGVPHLVKNGVLFGEPLAPFVGGGSDWHVQNWFKGDGGPETVRWIHMTYPLALVYGKYGMQHGTLSPLILAFFPLVVLSWRRAKPLRSPLFQVIVAAVFGVIVFTCLSPNVFAPRYILTPLLLLILPAALGAQLLLGLKSRGRALPVLIVGAIIVVLIGRLSLDVSKGGRDAGKYGWGRCVNSERLIPDCGSAKVLNDHAKPDEPVVLMTYYCYWVRSDLIKSYLTPKRIAPMNKLATSQERWRWLYQRGVRLVLLDARTFGSETAECITAGPLKTSEVPEGFVVNVLYRKEGRIVLQLQKKARD
ncbi:MAG: hypothetical protein GY794_26165 [bacterium]|nr:hypothetical protein [bacterium]